MNIHFMTADTSNVAAGGEAHMTTIAAVWIGLFLMDHAVLGEEANYNVKTRIMRSTAHKTYLLFK